MKTRFIYFSMIMLALVSCAKVQEENIDSPEEVTPVSVKSLVVNTVIPETKVTISPDGDEYKMSWDGDESAKLVERSDAAANASLYTSRAIDVTAGKAAFTFDGLTPVAGTTVYNYDILYPASAVGAATGDVIAMTMPATQTPGASSPDGAASLLAGRNATDFDAQPASVNANFNHLAAYGKMTMTGLSLEGGETLTSISITAEDCNIAGAFNYNAADGTVDYGTGVSTVTLSGTNLSPAVGGFNVWFACKPFTLTAGKTMTVVTTTSLTTHTAVLTAKVNIDFTVGKVTELPVSSDTYTVTFDTQGGSVVTPKVARKGYPVSEPAEPTKAEDLAQGLYPGDIDPDSCYATFGGWYTDAECTSAYDFSTTVTSSFTLYAKWTEHEPIDTAPNAAASNNTIVHESVNYVNAQTLDSETHYTLVLKSDVQYWGGTSSLNKTNAVLHIVGGNSERKIYSTSKWLGIQDVQAGTLVLGKNLWIYSACTEGHAHSLLSIGGTGNIVLEEGCRLSGSTNLTKNGSIVHMNSGKSTFTMNGGEITGNSISGNDTAQSVIYVANGTFTMNGGVISGNTVTTSLNTTNISGAVLLPGWTYSNDSGARQFVKNGGEIKDNTATRDVGATGEKTGLRGQEVLLAGRGGDDDKKIDSNIGSAQNLNAGSCWSSPWEKAAL